jgi:rare lipoprotein A
MIWNPTLSPRWQRLRRLGSCTACALALAACATPPEGGSGSNAGAGSKSAIPTQAALNAKNKGSSAGDAGNWNLFGYDRDDPLAGHSFDGLRPDVGTFEQRGEASWYGKGFQGRKTANGERFDMHAMTAAHPSLPLDSWVLVRNLRNNKVAMLRINDRGPYHRGRVLDVSYGAAKRLGMVAHGAAQVEIRRLSRTEVAALAPQMEAGGNEMGDGAGDDDIAVPGTASTLAPVKSGKSRAKAKRH